MSDGNEKEHGGTSTPKRGGGRNGGRGGRGGRGGGRGGGGGQLGSPAITPIAPGTPAHEGGGEEARSGGRRGGRNRRRNGGKDTPGGTPAAGEGGAETPASNKTPRRGGGGGGEGRRGGGRRGGGNQTPASSAGGRTPNAKTPAQGGGAQKKAAGRKGRRREREVYKEHLPEAEARAGVANKTLYAGVLRMNPKSHTDAFVTVEGFDIDIYIDGAIHRNRALHGDTVAVKLLPRNTWKTRVAKNEVSDDENDPRKKKPRGSGASTPASGVSGTPTPRSSEAAGAAAAADMSVNITIDADADGRLDAEVEGDEEGEGEDNGDEDDESEGDSLSESEDGEGAVAAGAAVTPVRPTGAEIDALVGDARARATPSAAAASPAPKEEAQPRATVVAILESRRNPLVIGKIVSPRPSGEFKANDVAVNFVPVDMRMPKIIIPMRTLPADVRASPAQFANYLLTATIDKWPAGSLMPTGTVKEVLGEGGMADVETRAILMANDINYEPFSEEVVASLAPFHNFSITPAEVAKRRDFRTTRIFTIDPATARDLDDALHVTPLANGDYEVGVHIADVSHFVLPETALDKEAQDRATSTYMVQEVIPMLPRLLCEELCSLNPSVDRLAFSVVWTLNSAGEIKDEWFGKSVIRSCVKMNYDLAQGCIEGKITAENAPEFFQVDATHGHTHSQVVEDCLNFHKLAVQMRARRYKDGCLTLHKAKLSIQMDRELKKPTGWCVYEQKDSNRLVEEFMLLANMSVARRIVRSYPGMSLLRRHPAPLKRKLDEMARMLAKHGWEVDGSSSGALAGSLRRCQADPKAPPFLLEVMEAMLTQPMQTALYVCSGVVPEDCYHHYALNAAHYTHFTSPIRRYADVVVHRLLMAALAQPNATAKNISPPPGMDTDWVREVAAQCNRRKMGAKTAQEQSGKLYLSILLRDQPLLDAPAVVAGIGEGNFTILVPACGIEKRMNAREIPGVSRYAWSASNCALTLTWKSGFGSAVTFDDKGKAVVAARPPTVIKLFDSVRVNVKPLDTKWRPDIDVELIL